MTIRLYLEDAQRTAFEAQVVASRRTQAGWEVALDRTCFYPTGGGQPHDLGTLGGLAVLDVREEGDEVWHLLPELPAATHLHGEIDRQRRFDHMQQHSGQHLLSAIALEQLNAQTVSFHLGTESATIDLDVAGLSPADLELAEEEVNRAIVADLPIHTYLAAPEEIAALPLRKPPVKGERPRIVEIDSIDLSPCSGTHVRSTGQIGLVKVRRSERYKGGTRVEFLCGWRALHDYRWKHAAIASLARDMTVADREVEAALRRALASEKEARRQVEALRAELLAHEAAALRQGARDLPSAHIVCRLFAERSPAEVKQLAGLLVAQPGMIALLASSTPRVRLVFARSADVPVDMRDLLQRVTARYGGGGGGRQECAEGGGLPAERAAEALEWAVALLAGGESGR